MSENLLAYRLLKSGNLPELHEQMVKGAITDLKINLWKINWKICLENPCQVLKNAPLKQRIPSMLNMLVETIMRNCTKVTSVMMKNDNNKKQTLQVIPNDFE